MKWLTVFIVSVLANVTQTAFCADIIVNSAAKANLPAVGTAGRLYRVTDDVRGLWMDQGSQWFALTREVINVKEFGAKGDGTTNDSSAIQSAIDAVSSSGGAVFFPPGTYLLNTGLTVDKNKLTIFGYGWGSATLKANAAITILLIRDAERVNIHGLKLDGNSKTATAGLSFLPTTGGARNQYSSVRDVTVTSCQTGMVIGATNNYSVVGLSISGFTVTSNNIGIQLNGTNTGDIFFSDGAVTDNSTVGVDLGTSMGAAFRGVSTNGLNGAADFRAGDTANTLLTIEDHIGNPSQGPFVLVNGVYGQQMALSVILKNCSISWNGTAGNDIIKYLGQGTVTIIGGNINGNGVIRVSPTQALSYSGPTLIDINLTLRGSPEPSFVVTNGRRFSIGALSLNAGTLSGVQTTNMPNIESVQTFSNGDATPSVELGNVFKTNGTTTITNFDNGFVGQRITILAISSITIQNNTNILLSGAANFAMTSNDTLTLVQVNSGVWVEVARSVN